MMNVNSWVPAVIVDIPYLFSRMQPNKVLAKLLGSVVMKVTRSHKQSLIFRLKFPTYPSPTPTVYEGIPFNLGGGELEMLALGVTLPRPTQRRYGHTQRDSRDGDQSLGPREVFPYLVRIIPGRT